jgi:hypothetical protein
MGQPITVLAKPTPRPDVMRFETNRAITGMGHESFDARPDEVADRAVDNIVRQLFDAGGVQAVHVNSNVLTIVASGHDVSVERLKSTLEDAYTYYRPGVRVPKPEDFATDDGEASE